MCAILKEFVQLDRLKIVAGASLTSGDIEWLPELEPAASVSLPHRPAFVLISPKDKEGFVRDLAAAAPQLRSAEDAPLRLKAETTTTHAAI